VFSAVIFRIFLTLYNHYIYMSHMRSSRAVFVLLHLLVVLSTSELDGVEEAGLVLWVGGSPDASFGFHLREAFQSHTNAEKILYNKSH